MRTLTSIAIAAALLLLTAASAAAQDRAAADQAITEHTFEDPDQVEGATTGPHGINVGIRRAYFVGTLIQPRAHFRPELLKSVEDL